MNKRSTTCFHRGALNYTHCWACADMNNGVNKREVQNCTSMRRQIGEIVINVENDCS